ncbi:MAG: transposase [Actinomycetota bacterium]
MARPSKYPPEVRQRAVRLVHDSGRPIAHVAKDLGVGEESLRKWVKQDELDRGRRTAGWRGPGPEGYSPGHSVAPSSVGDCRFMLEIEEISCLRR